MFEPLSRRAFLERAAVIGAAAAGAGLVVSACTSGGAPACNDATTDATAQQTRTSVAYVSSSSDPAKKCDGCMLFTAGQGCGTCSAVPGPISPAGTCNAFVART